MPLIHFSPTLTLHRLAADTLSEIGLVVEFKKNGLEVDHAARIISDISTASGVRRFRVKPYGQYSPPGNIAFVDPSMTGILLQDMYRSWIGIDAFFSHGGRPIAPWSSLSDTVVFPQRISTQIVEKKLAKLDEKLESFERMLSIRTITSRKSGERIRIKGYLSHNDFLAYSSEGSELVELDYTSGDFYDAVVRHGGRQLLGEVRSSFILGQLLDLGISDADVARIGRFEFITERLKVLEL